MPYSFFTTGHIDPKKKTTCKLKKVSGLNNPLTMRLLGKYQIVKQRKKTPKQLCLLVLDAYSEV